MMLPEGASASSEKNRTIYVAGFGERGSAAGLAALEELRRAGVIAVSDFRAGTLKAHLRQADRLGCGFSLILGDDEAQKGSAVLRNMQTKAQIETLLSSLVSQVKNSLASS